MNEPACHVHGDAEEQSMNHWYIEFLQALQYIALQIIDITNNKKIIRKCKIQINKTVLSKG